MDFFVALAVAAYSGAIALLGGTGTVVGQGQKTAVAIAISSLWDLERAECSTPGKSLMLVGIEILIVAVVHLGIAQVLFGNQSQSIDKAQEPWDAAAKLLPAVYTFRRP